MSEPNSFRVNHTKIEVYRTFLTCPNQREDVFVSDGPALNLVIPHFK